MTAGATGRWTRAWGTAAVLGFALLAGASLYEAVLVAPRWALEPAASVRDWLALPWRPDSTRLFPPLVAATAVAVALAWLPALFESGRRRWWLTLSLAAAAALAFVSVTAVMPLEGRLVVLSGVEADPASLVELVELAADWLRAALARAAATILGGWAAWRALLAGRLADAESARRAEAVRRAPEDFSLGDEEDPVGPPRRRAAREDAGNRRRDRRGTAKK